MKVKRKTRVHRKQINRGAGKLEQDKADVLDRLVRHIFLPKDTPEHEVRRAKKQVEDLAHIGWEGELHDKARPWKFGTTRKLYRGDTGDNDRNVVKFWNKPSNEGSYSATTDMDVAQEFADAIKTGREIGWFHNIVVPPRVMSLDVKGTLNDMKPDEWKEYHDRYGDEGIRSWQEYEQYIPSFDSSKWKPLSKARQYASNENEQLILQPNHHPEVYATGPDDHILKIYSRPLTENAGRAHTNLMSYDEEKGANPHIQSKAARMRLKSDEDSSIDAMNKWYINNRLQFPSTFNDLATAEDWDRKHALTK